MTHPTTDNYTVPNPALKRKDLTKNLVKFFWYLSFQERFFVGKEAKMTGINNGSFYAFIPKHLEIAERPELNIFSYNVLIVMLRVNSEGKVGTGSVIYEPDLSTYQDSGTTQGLRYFNIYNHDFGLDISFDKENDSYSCRKFNKEKLLGIADGREWKQFFVQVGILGIADGETCLFEEINKTT